MGGLPGRDYFFFSFRPALIASVERQLLSCHLSVILDKGFRMLVEGHRLSDLSLLYHLTLRVRDGEKLCSAWASLIKVSEGGKRDEIEHLFFSDGAPLLSLTRKRIRRWSKSS